jgi:hypothetical protein
VRFEQGLAGGVAAALDGRPLGKGFVYYLPPAEQSVPGLRRVLRDTPTQGGP